MNRYLLLIILSSWAHVVPLSLQCETGVAYPNHVLSVPRSLMNNADVAIIKTYQAETVDKCITDCCAEKYGACSVASFKKNTTDGSNCQHFNCLPVEKCKFLSSSSTDSFSFTSSSSPKVLVPSSNASKDKTTSSSTASTITTSRPRSDKLLHSEQNHEILKETLAPYSEELPFKDDNTTIKPRKGVDDATGDLFENVTRSGIKPRKGVNLDGVTNSNNTKSKVKPRKGVGPYLSHSSTSSRITAEPTSSYKTSSSLTSEHSSKSSVSNTYKDISDDVVSALQKVFEDDTTIKDFKPFTSSSAASTLKLVHTHTTTTNTHFFVPTTVATVHSSSSVEQTTSSVLQSSLATNDVASSSVQTPDLTTSFQSTKVVSHTPMPSSRSPIILEHSKLLFHEVTRNGDRTSKEILENENSVESESERKYKSSMHLVLSLVFGLLVLFSVLGVVAKRVYDGWMRRHYRRMDFLIDGMYNGYG